jgi:hypothetical protein
LLLSQGGISLHSDFPASALLLCCEKAGADPSRIKYWEDLLDAVKKCKAAGVTAIAVGGFEKWPLQFYPALLMMRIILGKDGMESACKGDNGGFAGPDVVKAWKMYEERCDRFAGGGLIHQPASAVNQLAVRRLGSDLTNASGDFSIDYEIRNDRLLPVNLALVAFEPGLPQEGGCPQILYASCDVRVGAAEVERFAIAISSANLKSVRAAAGKSGAPASDVLEKLWEGWRADLKKGPQGVGRLSPEAQGKRGQSRCSGKRLPAGGASRGHLKKRTITYVSLYSWVRVIDRYRVGLLA